jgi:hypothetical protein
MDLVVDVVGRRKCESVGDPVLPLQTTRAEDALWYSSRDPLER